MAQPQQIQIKGHDDVLKGSYANVLQISHTKEEVVFDWLSVMPPQGQIVARVITSPGHAKRVLAALQENLKQYEAKFGKIAPAEAPKGDFGFSA